MSIGIYSGQTRFAGTINQKSLHEVKEREQYVIDASSDAGDPIQAVSVSGDNFVTQAMVGFQNNCPIITVSYPDSTKQDFSARVTEWKNNRRKTASLSLQIASDPNYLRIIGMGPRAVPYILREMQRELAVGEPLQWFPALWAITGENPIPEENQGKIVKMAEAWIAWGKNKGMLDAGVGVWIPEYWQMGMHKQYDWDL